MKRIVLVVLAGLVLFTFSCNEDAKKEKPKAVDGYITYTSDSLGLELKYPESFTKIDYLKPEIPLSFFEFKEDSINYLFLPNMAINYKPIPPVQISLTEYLKGYRTGLSLEMKNRNPDFKTYEIDSFESHGLTIGYFKYEAPKSADTIFLSKTYIIMQPQKAMLINCTSLKNVFDKYEPIYDKFIKSIKFKQNS